MSFFLAQGTWAFSLPSVCSIFIQLAVQPFLIPKSGSCMAPQVRGKYLT